MGNIMKPLDMVTANFDPQYDFLRDKS